MNAKQSPTPTKTKKIFVSACEPSSNLHLKALSKHLDSHIEICGIFDKDSLQGLNANPSYTLKDFAIMGFFDVIKKIFFFEKALREMIELAQTCDVIVLMDSSSFNIPLAQGVKKTQSKVPIIYYILPQVWAWKAWRAKKIQAVCDRLCAILPFELMMYPEAVKTQKITYVGHPLLDEIPTLKNEVIPRQKGPIAFMPGSRKIEIKKIFPIFLEVAKKLDMPKILVIPEHFKSLDSQSLKAIYGEGLEYFEISFDANATLLQSSFAFVCSGTATLQATLIGTPLVLGYKARSIELNIAKIFVKLQCIGLANIFYNALHSGSPRAGAHRIHTELIQENLTAENLLKAYEQCDEQTFLSKAKEIRSYLGNGSAKNVAQILESYLQETL